MIFRNYLLINAPRVLIFDNVRKFARFLKMLLQPMLQLILAVYLLSLLFVLLPTWVELYICNITHRFFEQLSLPHRNEPWIEIFQVTLRSFFKSKNETIKIFFGFYINYKRKVKYILQKWFLQRLLLMREIESVLLSELWSQSINVCRSRTCCSCRVK